MSKDRLYIYDTTLRDGTQSEGFTLSGNDKIRIAQKCALHLALCALDTSCGQRMIFVHLLALHIPLVHAPEMAVA